MVPAFYVYFLTHQMCQFTHGKVLGGSSSVNYMAYIRGAREDYDGWAANGCEGWNYDDVLPYFKKSQKMANPKLKNDPGDLYLVCQCSKYI